MKSCTNIFFVLLTICLKLIYCQAQSVCAANKFKNDPSLLWTLKGILYTLYTSKRYEDNELFKFEPKDSQNFIFTRTTNAAKCCKSMYVDATPEDNGNYLKYVIATDERCPKQLIESARMKLLAANKTKDDYCLMVWTCRKSREGVHAFCSKKQLSNSQKLWIQKQYKTFGLTGEAVKQNQDLSKGKCFKKPSTTKT